MATTRSSAPKRSAKPSARRKPATRKPQPATLNGDHLRGFASGLAAGVIIGAAGILWLTNETQLSSPVPAAATAGVEDKVVKPRFDFFTVLPEEELDLAGAAEFQPRAGDNAVSEYQNYILQAGSFRRAEDADRRKGELALLGLESKVEQSTGRNGLWWRVYIGPFENRSAMMRARSLAAQSDIDTLLLRRSD